MGVILGVLVPVLAALPQLISAVETLWQGTPKAGTQKWISVEQALSGSIQAVANSIVKSVPNSEVDKVSDRVAVWAKAVNDATVAMMNDVGLLPTTPKA